MAKATVTRRTINTIIDIEPTAEAALMQGDGDQIRGFLAGISRFFVGAAELETQAKATLVEAQGLKAPKTAVEDERIQAFTKKTTEQTKSVKTYWQPKALFGRVHKACCAGESRALAPLEQANGIGNDFHNGWTREARRKQAEKQEAERLRAEAEAAHDRQVILDQMEAEAAAREEASLDLSEREQAFVARFVDEFSQTRNDGQGSAQAAGFKDALKSAARLLSSEKIQAAVKGRREAAIIRAQASAKKEAPLEVQVKTVTLDVLGRIGTTRWSAEILDEPALIEAIISGKYGIPRSVLTVRGPAMNDLAQTMHELLDRVPGVRAKSDTKV